MYSLSLIFDLQNKDISLEILNIMKNTNIKLFWYTIMYV